jgi:hypothetical protein
MYDFDTYTSRREALQFFDPEFYRSLSRSSISFQSERRQRKVKGGSIRVKGDG